MPSEKKAAVALEGGGFLSLTVQTAFTAGILARRKEKTMKASGIFNKFSTFSTVSGGSWVASFLIYSESFQKMLECMAIEPEKAGSLFLSMWAAKIYAPEPGVLPKAELDFLKKIGYYAWGGVGNSLMVVGTDNLKNFGWRALIETLFEKSAGIPPDLPMGTEKVNSWAKDKEFLCNVSQISPSGGLTSPLAADLDDKGSFVVNTDEKYPKFLPATFSIKVGSRSAALPFASTAATLPGFKYRSLRLGCCFCAPSVAQAVSEDGGVIESSQMAELPVAGCSASSSAYASFQGPFPQADENAGTAYPGSLLEVVYDAAAKAVDIYKLQTWICKNGKNPNAIFKEANQLRNAMLNCEQQAGLQACADKALRSLSDGGATEVTGVAWAVAAGARDVLLLHSNAQTSDAILSMFVDGPVIGCIGAAAVGPVFKDTASSAKQKMESFKTFKSANSGKFLKQINVGTLEAVTTANKWYGIAEGIPVTLHVVDFQTDLWVGSGNDDTFSNYSQLLQAIVSTVVDTDLGNLLETITGLSV